MSVKKVKPSGGLKSRNQFIFTNQKGQNGVHERNPCARKNTREVDTLLSHRFFAVYFRYSKKNLRSYWPNPGPTQVSFLVSLLTLPLVDRN